MKYADAAVSPRATIRAPSGTSRIDAPLSSADRCGSDRRANVPMRPTSRSRSAIVAARVEPASAGTGERSEAIARRHSAAGRPTPGATSAANAVTTRISDANTTITRTSMTSASPAPAMPSRKITSRITNRPENTRPRSSRGVLRWSRVDRATDAGELKNPLNVAQRIATQIVGERPYSTPAMPMPR